MNPYEFESNSDHGYVCQDCRDFRSGRCPEEDEGGEICSRFKTAIENLNLLDGGGDIVSNN